MFFPFFSSPLPYFVLSLILSLIFVIFCAHRFRFVSFCFVSGWTGDDRGGVHEGAPGHPVFLFAGAGASVALPSVFLSLLYLHSLFGLPKIKIGKK